MGAARRGLTYWVPAPRLPVLVDMQEDHTDSSIWRKKDSTVNSRYRKRMPGLKSLEPTHFNLTHISGLLRNAELLIIQKKTLSAPNLNFST